MRSNEEKLGVIEEMREWGNEEKEKDRKAPRKAPSRKKKMMSGSSGMRKGGKKS